MESIIDKLFKDDEHVNICINSPKESRNVYPVEKVKDVSDGKYFCINPLEAGSSRKQLNLTERRNILIEFDCDSLERQWNIIRERKIPYRTVVYSGNKSLHIIVAVDKDLGKCYYRSIMKRMKRVLPEADAACFEPARLSRLATDAQPLEEVGEVITVAQLENWLSSLGCSKEQYTKIEERQIAFNEAQKGKLHKTTMLLLAGQIPRENAHRATISSAKNLQELGYTQEQIIITLAKARQLTRPDELWEESVEKTSGVVNWVLREWSKKQWRD
jgi:hypothetical protein